MIQSRGFSFLLACLVSGLTAAVCQARNSVPDLDCPEYDEFVQSYEYTDRTLDQSAAACPGSVLGGAPSYPERRVNVRIEYLRGHYFVAQETREWSVDPQPAGCLLIQPRLVREFRLYRGGEVEWARYAPDKTKRTRDGHPVGNSLMVGTAKARQPRPTKVEETPFGVNCGRIDHTNMNPAGIFPGASMCSVYLPKKCTSELYMAPIEFIGQMPGLGPMRGRTVELVVGSSAGVDPTTWSIP